MRHYNQTMHLVGSVADATHHDSVKRVSGGFSEFDSKAYCYVNWESVDMHASLGDLNL